VGKYVGRCAGTSSHHYLPRVSSSPLGYSLKKLGVCEGGVDV